MTNYYQFSQSDLNLLETEPLQFVKNYLDNRLEPRHLENQNRTQRGKSFHVLMQQYNLGLNIDHMTGEDQSLIDQVKALINQTQQLWFSPQIILREAEYQVNYTCENYIFTAIYDLLVLFKDKAIIVDWKTYRQPQTQQIINSWQTKLYLYILAEQLNYPFEQIFFDYWFITSAAEINQYSLQYSQSFHQQIKNELRILLDKFADLINTFSSKESDHNYFEQSEESDFEENQIPISLEEIEAIEI